MEDPTNPNPGTENVEKAPETAVPEGTEVKEAAPEQTTPETAGTTAAAGQEEVAKQEPAAPVVKQPPVKSDEKIWGLASYLPLVAILALVVNPKSDFIKLHGRQGLLLFLISFFGIFAYIIPFIGYIIGMIVHFGIIAVGLLSMYQAFTGNWWKIPVLGDLAELIPVEIFTKVAREAAIGPKGIENDEDAKRIEDEKKAEEQPAVAETPAAEQEVTDNVAVAAAEPVEKPAPEPETVETKEPAVVEPKESESASKPEGEQQELPIEKPEEQAAEPAGDQKNE